jgi:uncharacterized protein YydD (DUF2326 family)
MALITEKKISNKEKIKLEIDQEIYSEINKYCTWSGVSDITHFFEEAARIVFSKDGDWKKYLKSMAK